MTRDAKEIGMSLAGLRAPVPQTHYTILILTFDVNGIKCVLAISIPLASYLFSAQTSASCIANPWISLVLEYSGPGVMFYSLTTIVALYLKMTYAHSRLIF